MVKRYLMRGFFPLLLLAFSACSSDDEKPQTLTFSAEALEQTIWRGQLLEIYEGENPHTNSVDVGMEFVTQSGGNLYVDMLRSGYFQYYVKKDLLVLQEEGTYVSSGLEDNWYKLKYDGDSLVLGSDLYHSDGYHKILKLKRVRQATW